MVGKIAMLMTAAFCIAVVVAIEKATHPAKVPAEVPLIAGAGVLLVGAIIFGAFTGRRRRQ